MLKVSDNEFRGNLSDVTNRQQEGLADAAFLIEEVTYGKASRYGVLDTNEYHQDVEVVKKPNDLPINS